MPKLIFTARAAAEFSALSRNAAAKPVFKAVRKALAFLELDPRHPSLRTHEFTSLSTPAKKVFEAYAQNNAPGAYRVFWHYGPDEAKGAKRIAVITIIAITPHP